ncbi:RhuM family protein [Streptomyces sp. H10-C2]|uniref:RhuM family protein n=1 Tax=unclassified Streptomyces TaxID=2593676 RepID=UPI0024B9AE2B|nr:MULTISPECIES: RhuM family protein [unclassified Streptomyces]MDJ0345228.1 RhuM family protein [Streptomyces sp. PH10-H1]MDJ0368826.1 RhuM family protein [Streptomyces sp. H10-C2]
MVTPNSNFPAPRVNSGVSPFDAIRRTDTFGREYWDAREMQPLMEYSRWEKFDEVIIKARNSLALVQGPEQAGHHFTTWGSDGGRWGTQKLASYRLTRFGAYLVAMAGDDTKEAVARARVYFAVLAREAELGSLTSEEIRHTALARAREMVDYRTFRDMMAENAPDYAPSSKATSKFFACMQNKLYRHLTGMDAVEIKNARALCHWPGREEGKPEPSAKSRHRKVAKNYLTVSELKKLNRMVGRLCLRAEDAADDGVHLSLTEWSHLVDAELTLTVTRALAA